MGRIAAIFHRPYPVTRGWRTELAFVLAIVVGAGTIFLITKPFGLSELSQDIATDYLLSVTALLLIYALIFQVLVPELLVSNIEEHWTTGREILYTSGYLLGVATIIYTSALHNGLARWQSSDLGVFIFMTLLASLPPVTFSVILKENWWLKKSLAEIEQLNSRTSTEATRQHGSKTIKLHGSTQETLELNQREFLYARAQQNYTEVVFNQGDAVAHKLLRISLSDLLEQLPGDTTFRSHRSYVVNLLKIQTITGNAQGYRLGFKSCESCALVSRRYTASFNTRYTQIK